MVPAARPEPRARTTEARPDEQNAADAAGPRWRRTTGCVLEEIPSVPRRKPITRVGHTGAEQFVEQAYQPVRADPGDHSEHSDGGRVAGMKRLGREPHQKLSHGLKMIGPDGSGR